MVFSIHGELLAMDDRTYGALRPQNADLLVLALEDRLGCCHRLPLFR